MPANAFTRRVMPGGVIQADVDRDAYSNALMRQNVAAEPDRARMRQLDIQGAEQDIDIRGKAFSEQQKANARGILANRFSAVAQAQNPLIAYQQLLGDPDFKAAGMLVGLPVDQFTFDGTETPDKISAGMMDWARAMGADAGQQGQTRVQSTFSGRNGNQWIVTADGRTVDTGVPVSQFAQRPLETGAGIVAFDPSQGTVGQPVSPEATAPALDVAAENRKFAENLGAGRGQAQADYEAGAPQRAERARQQITTIDNVIGALDQSMARVDWSTVGAPGALSKAIPGTPAYDLAQTLTTVRANIGFDRLQQMREASPTGGALGQVAVQELVALQASIASLDQAQSGEQLRQNLLAVKQHYQNWRNVILQSQQQGPPPLAMPNVGEIRDGYRFKGGNPALESSWESVR